MGYRTGLDASLDRTTHPWDTDRRALWERIAAHPFETPDIAVDFTRRLAGTLCWSLETARAGIEEYRRFCFLAASGSEPVTPSEEIDEIWHLHLTYSRDYWDEWCARALGCPLHHAPTEGGSAARQRFHAQYAETLARYEAAFGPPPARFWPGQRDRFRAHARYRVVDGDRVIVLPRPLWSVGRAVTVPVVAALVALASVVPASAVPDVLDWSGPSFLGFYVLVLMVAFALTFGIRRLLSAGGSGSFRGALSPVEIGFLQGGKSRAADTLAIGLSTSAAVTVTQSPPRIQISTARADLSRAFQPFRSLEQGTFTRPSFHRMFGRAQATARMRSDLTDAGLLVDGTRKTWCAVVTVLILAPVLALGVAKMLVGIGRDKPVGFLVVILMVAAVVALLTVFNGPRLTATGRATLQWMRMENARAVRAPRPSEVPLAFAFVGAAALAGTEHTAYAEILRSASSTGGGGCSGGDGGGGGGGCGGCGGGD